MAEYIKNYDRDKFPDLHDKVIGSNSINGETFNYSIGDILSLQDGRYLVALMAFIFSPDTDMHLHSGYMTADSQVFELVTKININKTNVNDISVTEYIRTLMHYITTTTIEIQIQDASLDPNFARYNISSIVENADYFEIHVQYTSLSSHGVLKQMTVFYLQDIASAVGSGGGDMRKAIYDRNNSGVVDDSELVNGLTVETAVPTNAVFTDTVYDDTALTGRVSQNEADIASIYLDKQDKDIQIVNQDGNYTTNVSHRAALISFNSGSQITLMASGLPEGFKQIVFNKTGGDINIVSLDNVLGVNQPIPAGYFAMYYLLSPTTWAVTAPIGSGGGGGGGDTLISHSDTPNDYGIDKQILMTDGVNMTSWSFIDAIDVLYDNTNSGIPASEVQTALDELKSMIDEIITPSQVRNFTFTGYSRYVDINHSFINPIFSWGLVGDPDDLILSDSEGLLPANLDVTGLESYASSATWTLGDGESVSWSISGSNIDTVSITSTAYHRSAWGVNSTGNIPTDTQIESGNHFLQPTNSSVSAGVLTTAEYGWIAVEVIQTGGSYTKWFISDTNKGDIGTEEFVKYAGRVQNVGSFNKEYDVYIYTYPSTNAQTITLSKN